MSFSCSTHRFSADADGDIKAPSPRELALIEKQITHSSEQSGLSDFLPGCRRNLSWTCQQRPRPEGHESECLSDNNWSNIDPQRWNHRWTSRASDSLIDYNSCFIRSISEALSGLLAVVTALLCVFKLQSVFSMMAQSSGLLMACLFLWWKRSSKPDDCFNDGGRRDTGWFIHAVTKGC